MSYKQVLSFVKEQLGKGVSKDLIEKKLLVMGNRRGEIKRALNSASKTSKTKTKMPGISMPKIGIPKRYWLIAGGVIALLIIISIIYTNPLTLNLIPAKTAQQAKYVYTEPTAQEIEMLKSAAEANDTSLCSNIKNEIMYYDCIDKIWFRGDCRYEYITKTNFDECVYKVALTTKDLKRCDEISDKPLSDKCREEIKKQTFNQASLDSQCKDDHGCFINLTFQRAIESKNCDIIGTFSFPEQKCFTDFQFSDINGIRFNNGDYNCVSKEQSKDYCYYFLSQYAEGSFCNKITNTGLKTNCNVEFSKESSLNTCDSLNNEEKDYCILRGFLIGKLRNVCNLISSSNIKDICLLTETYITSPINCNVIKSETFKNICVKSISKSIDCNSLPDEEQTNLCIFIRGLEIR